MVLADGDVFATAAAAVLRTRLDDVIAEDMVLFNSQ
jgi:hypothetical protein